MRSLIIFVLLMICISSYDEVNAADKKTADLTVQKEVSYLKDEYSIFTINQVVKADQQQQFLRSDLDYLNFGNSEASYWVKVSYKNTSQQDAFLVVDISNIEQIDFYSKDEKGKFIKITSGSMAPVHPKVITANNYIFTLPNTSSEAKLKTVYLKFKTDNILFVPIKIVLSEQLINGINTSDRFESIGIGILLSLLLFNISVYIKSRDLTYLYYSIRILALFCFYFLYFQGYSYMLGDDLRFFINAHPHLFIGIGSIAGIAFSYRFLNLKDIFPNAVKVISLLIAAWCVIILMSLIGQKHIASEITHFLIAITTATLLSLGVAAYMRGVRVALYFVISWLFVCITTACMVFCLGGFLPYNETYFHLFPLGFIFELLLLSLALGDRLEDMKRSRKQVQAETLRIQEENLYLISTQNERLEKIVESRTKALRKLVQSLESANADKTRIFSIIAHDLRSPFNSLISLFSLNDMDMLTFDDVKLLLLDSRKSVDNIHNTLNNLLYWAQSQMKGISTTPSRFNMRVMVQDLMLVYQPLIKKKNINTEVIVVDDTDVFADLNQLNLVMRNLIDNAIKFTPLGKLISITISGNSSQVFVDVKNPVLADVNIESFIIKERNEPSYGTSNERGVGLGLHLCRDFVEKNKGLLQIRKEDKCVIIGFNLMKFIRESESERALEMSGNA